MEKIIILPSMTIKEAIKRLDETAKKILLVVEDEILLGVVTDGDIRRWILRDGDLNQCVKEIMNESPRVIKEYNREKAKQLILKQKLQAIPVVDEKNRIKDIIFLEEVFGKKEQYKKVLQAPVVIMAGGKGTRLYPYTKVLPKPLIPIGEKTILERIIDQFVKVGCNQIYLTVNYKKNMIKAYLDDLPKQYSVSYVEEECFLGTAGSLYLLKDYIQETFFVSNCDILVNADYEDLMKYHKENKNKITIVTSLKHYTIPYGIIKNDNKGCILTLEEKPEYNFQVNTGFYVLEPEVLADVPENRFFHITDLINLYMAKGEKVGIYPIMENQWLDMGEIKEMENMIQKLGLDE